MQHDTSYKSPNHGFYCQNYAESYFSQVSAKTDQTTGWIQVSQYQEKGSKTKSREGR